MDGEEGSLLVVEGFSLAGGGMRGADIERSTPVKARLLPAGCEDRDLLLGHRLLGVDLSLLLSSALLTLC